MKILEQNTHQELVDTFGPLLQTELPQIPEQRKSFLEIANFPDYENVITNFYAFYLDEKEEHGFKRLFLDALCLIIEQKKETAPILEEPEIWTESATNAGGRIDLLLIDSSNDAAIIIENKIYASLNNDLEDYWSSVKATNKFGVVLSVKRLKPKNENFINITHQELLKAVKNKLGNYLKDADDRHLLFLRDFMENMSWHYNQNTTMKDIYTFYAANREKINELAQIKDQARLHFLDSLKQLCERDKDLSLENSNPRNYRCLNIKGNKPKLRFWIEMDRVEDQREYIEIFLELVGSSIKNHYDTIIGNEDFNKKYEDLIYPEESKYRKGLTIMGKGYAPNTQQFADLTKYFEEKINTDWKPVIEEVRAMCKK